jgi:hypothetical protein
VFGEFSTKFAKVAGPRPSSRTPSSLPTRGATRPSEPVDGVDAYALTHCETSTGVAMPVRAAAAPRGGARRWSTPRAPPAACRSTPPSSTSTTSPRRRRSRARAACGSRCVARGDRAHRASSRRAAPHPRHARPRHRGRQLAGGPDLQHARDLDAVPHGRADRLDERPGRPRWAARSARARRSTSTAGRPSASGPAPFVADPAQRSAVVCTIDLDDRVSADDVERSCAPTGSSTPRRTASSAATSCGSPCSPRSISPTSSGSPRRSTTSSRRSRDGSTMTPAEFRRHGREVVDLIADYLETIEDRPVRAQVEPGWVRAQLPPHPPEAAGGLRRRPRRRRAGHPAGPDPLAAPALLRLLPGERSGRPSSGELLSAGLGVQGMLWATSPAATELETHVLDWLRELLDLPVPSPRTPAGAG